MKAAVGDQLHVRGHSVGDVERIATIVEIRGSDGTPPYRVRFPDGHETLVFPGPDATIEPAKA
jgi:hypothetical protein